MAFSTLTFSSRIDSLSVLTGGSIARLVRIWKRWFWTTSRIVAGLIVESASALHAEIFRHRDLHALDMVAIPERLQKRVGEPEEQHVADGLLAQVMVDAKYRLTRRNVPSRIAIQLARRGQVGPERLFHDDAGAFRAIRFAELLYDQPEQRRRDSEIVRRLLARSQVPCECA